MSNVSEKMAYKSHLFENQTTTGHAMRFRFIKNKSHAINLSEIKLYSDPVVSDSLKRTGSNRTMIVL